MPSQSYLDCCISNLNLINLIKNKIETADYDSDHRALIFYVQLKSNVQNTQEIKKFNYKATKWPKFIKHLSKEFTAMPPNDRTLSIPEIDTYIQDITASILNSIEATVPIYKKQDSVLKYINARIKKL